ncbi:MAG: prolipoprotein diacylglyceryl transferase [Polyangiaceae bacterium]|nr:prolipoprotein diacylglyceryl transferase [Polyangiaceae bacterium]
MIPYVELSGWVFLARDSLATGMPPMDLAVRPFGTLVALGVYLAGYITVLRARQRGVSDRLMTSFLLWVAGSGFVFGHVLDTLMYYPEEALRDPWSVLRLWEGLSSFGGFIGGVFGAVLWRTHYGTPAFVYADLMASCFPLGFMIGRVGCAVVHDHPGIASEAWYAVDFPQGGMLDLGLLEVMALCPLVIGFAIAWRTPKPWGFYLGVMSVAYAPVRFSLDFLRRRDGYFSDVRYAELTPAQWGSCALLIVGAFIYLRAMTMASFASPTLSRRGSSRSFKSAT